MRSRLPEGNQRGIYRKDESGVFAGELELIVARCEIVNITRFS